MAIYMCRWPNGDLSFVSARSKKDAVIKLDQWDNAELAEIRQVRDFMIDFMLSDDGDLELQAIGEETAEIIDEHAFPLLADAKRNTLADETGEPMPVSVPVIRAAVHAERERLSGKKRRKVADTETGKSLQKQTGLSAALANRYVKQAADQLLKNYPATGGKQ